MIVGRIAEIWRHPVKSMEGERLARTDVGANGLPGDRAWAVRDEVRGGIRGAKKLPGLMRCKARYTAEPEEGRVTAPEIALPHGSRVYADAADAADRVGAAIDAKVSLWPLLPPTALEHYKRGAPDHEDVQTELRAIFGREPDEPLPNFAIFPPEIFQYESPPGTYFDAFPLLLVTDATLRRLGELAPSSVVDVRRFRPNFLIETADKTGAALPEIGWAGKRIRIGGATIAGTVPCPRCVMITHGFGDVPRDPSLMRTVVRELDQNVGLYASVATPGAVQVGDPVEVLD
jgi:uncharacterized protein YcbX